MELGRVEVGAVGPDQSVALWINAHLTEELGLGEGSVNFSNENRPEVDDLFGGIGEANPEGVIAEVLERRDSVDLVGHGTTSTARS